MKRVIQSITVVLSLAAGLSLGTELSPIESLGKRLFFDTSLSTPPGQSCASCHTPEAGWSGPDSQINDAGAVYPGAVYTRFGNRRPPTSAYAGFNPVLHKCCSGMGGSMGGNGGMGGGMQMTPDTFVGGLFWDGRATGWLLGDPLAEQAMGPFLNPLEQNNPNAKHVCLGVVRSDYAVLFEQVWGPGSLDCVKDVKGTYERIARSVAAYERSAEVNPFSSKFDLFWNNARKAGLGVPGINMMNWQRFRGLGLDDMELRGLMLFNTKGKCSACHTLRPMQGSRYPLFTDFRYHNLGMPKNPLNPFYDMPKKWNPSGENWVDLGLGGFLSKTAGMTGMNGVSRDYTAFAAANYGKHKTPTLRNVDMRPSPDFVKAYGHNGYFKSLQEILHFYNLRDVLPVCGEFGNPGVDCFPPAEVAENVDTANLGNLGLVPSEGMAIIAFMKTLTDGYVAP